VREAAETAAVAVEASGMQTRIIVRVVVIILFVLLMVAACIWMLYTLEGVLLLVILSIFFAYLIAPLVELIHRPLHIRGRTRKIPRALAIGVVYIALFGTIGTTLYFLLPQLGTQLGEFAKNAPDYLTNAQSRAQSLDKFYDQMKLPSKVRKTANDAVNGVISGTKRYLIGSTDKDGNDEGGEGVQRAMELLGYLPWLVLVPILAFFLLKDADSFRRSALQMLPRGRIRWRGDELFQDMNSTLAAYIRAQLIACVLIGTICTIGFYLLGVPYALVLGVMAGFFEFIPLVGPLFVAIIASAVTLFSSGSSGGTVTLLIFLFILRIVHDYVTYPRIIGSGIHLHPLAVILAILAGHEMAGIAGIFLAIPVIAIITVTYRHWLEHRGSEGLVADLLKPTDETANPTPDANALAPAAVEPSPTPTDA
jgi:predicted PurR-regulated permease PerM